MKVVHLSSVHYAFDTRIFHRLCKSLVGFGYDVDLIVQHDRNETIEGVNIIALPVAKTKSDRFTKCIPALIGFCKSYSKKQTLFHFHDPELIPIGLWLRMIGFDVIYDVHEDVPSTIIDKVWIPRILRKTIAFWVKYLESLIDKKATAIITVTEKIAERFKNSNKVLVQNFPSINELKIDNNGNTERKKTFVYVGDIQKVRGVTTLVEVAELLKGKATFILAGKLSDSYKRELEQLKGWENTKFVGFLDRQKLALFLSEAGVGLVTFLPLTNHINAQPNKLFEYMSAGVPVVASHFPLWQKIINPANVGLTVNPEDTVAISNVILSILNDPKLAEEMGESGRKIVKSKYNWESEFDKVITLYKIIEQKMSKYA